jgi:trimethylamine-N-oxide reductase cytochrome c-type subunit TorC
MKFLLKTLISSVLLLGSFSQVSASDLFVVESDSVLKSKNAKIAKLFIGVPVSVKKDNGETLDVVVKGFQDGVNIYSSKGKELLIATLDKDFKVTKKAGKEVELTGTIAKDAVSDDIEAIWDETQELYFEMCSVCHAPPQVKHLSMIEWEAIYPSMKVKTTLDEEESAGIVRFLKSNSNNGLIKTEH